jgi:hypothetical protein
VPRSSGASAGARRHAAQVGLRALEAIERCEAITIARLHGHVIGGGLVLALGCDLRVAAAGASFHIPEVDLGVPLTWGAAPRLAREVGLARAKELILLCDRFDAAGRRAVGHPEPRRRRRRARRDGRRARAPAGGEAGVGRAHDEEHSSRPTRARPSSATCTAIDGDLLRAASAEDPTRFAFPKRDG